jgi:hypothetical protein
LSRSWTPRTNAPNQLQRQNESCVYAPIFVRICICSHLSWVTGPIEKVLNGLAKNLELPPSTSAFASYYYPYYLIILIVWVTADGWWRACHFPRIAYIIIFWVTSRPCASVPSDIHAVAKSRRSVSSNALAVRRVALRVVEFASL